MPDPRQRPEDAGERVVSAAVDLVRRRGLTVGLDRISLEEAIAASGVARATAYRRWPTRDEFRTRVLLRVARDVDLEPETDEDIAALRRLVAGDRAALATPEGWRTLVVESLRITTDSDFRRLAGSAAWRDHLALRATCSTLPEGDLRDAVAAELAASERAFTDRRARVYGRLPAVLGYRLVPWLDPADGFTRMAEATGAMMTGLVARAAVVPPGPPTPMRAFGSGALAPWTTEAYAVTATILAFLEPDPDVVWDAARLDLAVARSAELEREARLLRRE
ncbi:hypothetical protein CHO01_10750 [Cellulomonas hominis]|uniref:AcrR family transcriptional regulator n=1 Tax=Cellulomonas hominis TaxID=156981 RepID=A0A511F9M1_9CELL|nr:hypothetical protein [Cellulomonas hominis]MBB5473577.1 AcrR family transcriptional regulator [Cellulomonas hominis]GEL45959.1 hypothetical protein CHO01_10750 [Cellulomonas hominis]